MGICYTIGYIIRTSILFGLLYSSFASSSSSSTMSFRYHNGTLLHGRFSVNLVWYGNFKPAQRAIIADFVQSLTSASMRGARPSVVAWWNAMGSLYRVEKTRSSLLTLSLGKQVIDERYSLGKSLSMKQVENLANKGGRQVNAVNLVLTSDDVAVQGMCSGRCGTHASSRSGTPSKKKHIRYPYVWVGNSGKQCPGQCAWPFHRPIYGPQGPALVAPNGDVGLDGMVINLASLLAGTATNPFGNGYFQGPREAPLEAATACTGVYGKGAYPGYAGKLLVDRTSGASYNANGVNGRKFLLPALYDPKTSTCFTLV